MKNSNHTKDRSAGVFIVTAGILTAAIGFLALLGWIERLPLLTTFGTNIIPLAPSTALFLIVLGGALSVHHPLPRHRGTHLMSIVVASGVMVTGLVLFCSSSAGIYSPIEHLGLPIAGKVEGHMSPLTAACFLVSALSFFLTLSPSLQPQRRWGAFACALLLTVTASLLLIAYLLGSPILYGSKIIPPSLPACVAFFILALGLLLSAALRIWSYDKMRDAANDRDSVALLFILFFSAAGIIAGGYFYFKNYEAKHLDEVEQRLSAVAELKTDELVEWRKERLNDGSMVFKNSSFAKLVRRYVESSADKDAQHQLQVWMSRFQSQDQYNGVFLLDSKGIPRISVSSDGVPLASAVAERVSQRGPSAGVSLLEFYRNEQNQKINYSIVVPIIDEQKKNRYLGSLVMVVDPAVFLYPFIQSWPTASRTSETLIVRRDGNDALFLNDAKFSSNAALNLRIPLENKNVLAVKAVLGEKGIVEGIDYRGAPVIGYICAIPNSDWYLIARMDIEEVYAPLRERLWLIEILILVLLAAATVGIASVWRHQRNRFFREQYKTTEALRNSESRYRRLFEAARDGILILDAETGAVVDVNPFLVEMLGYSREQFFEKKIWELGFFKDVAASKENFLQLQQNEFIRYEDLPLETSAGRKLNVEFVSNVYFVDQHKVIQCNIRDITERKLAEESFARLAAIVESSDDAIIGKDLSGIITSWNTGAEKLFGYSEHESVGRSINQIVPQDRLDEEEQVLGHIRRDEGVQHFETIRLSKDGRLINVSVTSSPIRDAAGNVVGVSKVARDITERKRMETALFQHTERLQNLHRIDHAILQAIESPESIVQTAVQQLRFLLNCNRASIGIFDFEMNEVRVFAADVQIDSIVQIGKKMEDGVFGDIDILKQGKLDVVEDLSEVKLQSPIAKILQSEGIQSYINVPLKSAHRLYGALNVGWEVPRTFIPEEIEIVEEVAAEVTIAIEQAWLLKEAKRYAAELEHRVKERTAQLETSNKELDAFAYSVSHDLRAPLRSIDGFSLVLLEEYGQKFEEAGRDSLQRVRAATQRMGQLIDDLLGLSHVSRSDLHRENVNLSLLAQGIATGLGESEAGRNVEWVIPPGIHAVGDAQLLHVVFDNLLRNAFKFTSNHAKARIEFGMSNGNGTPVYYVRDDGAGFDMKYADKMFGAFQRMHSSVEFPGTGIGLATVHRIINRHGGRVWAESEVEKGATFYFTLP